MARIAVHVTPRASDDRVLEWRGAELLVRVTAPPDGGKANAALCRLLSKTTGVPKGSVTVVRGQTARHKMVEFEGMEIADLYAVFGEPDPQLID